MKVEVKCYLLLAPTSTKVRCYGKLVYKIFGKTKSLKIFSFTKPVNSFWKWNRTYGGSWSFKFKVPLPPPVSFISIRFYVKVNYYFKIALSSKRLSVAPFRWKLGMLVETGINTDARASLRVWPL